MEFKLINDRIPTIIKDEYGIECNVAVVDTNKFYANLLLQQLVDSVNKLIATRHPMYIADAMLAIETLINNINGGREFFDRLYAERLNRLGRFDERYIGFFEEGELEKITDAFLANTPAEPLAESQEPKVETPIDVQEPKEKTKKSQKK